MAEEIITKKDIQELLSDQANVILDAVDKRFDAVDKRFEYVDRQIKDLDLKFTEKFNELTTTLDKFLKRMTDMEDEFAMMRQDINRVKKVIKEKLGVDLT